MTGEVGKNNNDSESGTIQLRIVREIEVRPIQTFSDGSQLPGDRTIELL
jgi:hypothetical protein